MVFFGSYGKLCVSEVRTEQVRVIRVWLFLWTLVSMVLSVLVDIRRVLLVDLHGFLLMVHVVAFRLKFVHRCCYSVFATMAKSEFVCLLMVFGVHQCVRQRVMLR